MLTDGERFEAERVAERMRERYRHLMADEAKRRYRVEQAAKQRARWELMDKHGADEWHDSEEAADE